MLKMLLPLAVALAGCKDAVEPSGSVMTYSELTTAMTAKKEWIGRQLVVDAHGALSPETTEGREGYVHPMRLAGGAPEASVWFIARDHDDERLEEHVELVRRIATEIVGAEPRASFTLDVEEQYRNMRGVLDRHPEIVEVAEEAIRRAGVEPMHTIIRGGTDGARLTEKGLPTPNLFTGGQHYHSLREWASLQDMTAAAATCIELVKLWGERLPG